MHLGYFLFILYSSFKIIIFNGITLKTKETEIQWRKLEIKRSCIFKVMNF